MKKISDNVFTCLELLSDGSPDVFALYSELYDVSTYNMEAISIILSSEERFKADRLRLSSDRNSYIVAHAILKICLRIITGHTEFNFQFGHNGKPKLSPEWGSPPIMFNLSHCTTAVACAFVRGAAVGIDAETTMRPIDTEIDKQILTPDELSHISHESNRNRTEILTSLWAAKEAVTKARGDGLSLDLQKFSVGLTETSHVHFSTELNELDREWFVSRHRVRETHLAVACASDKPAPKRQVIWCQVHLGNLLAGND